MGRKVAYVTALVGLAVMSVVLMGGQVGTGRFFENGNHEPIYIYGDGDFTEANGVRCGDGSPNNPYIIEGWTIDAPSADYGIYVDHTTAHFVVRDCVVERARIAGVYFNTVRNAKVEWTRIALSDVAVYLLNSQRNKFSRNTVMYCRSGVMMGARAMQNIVAENVFLENGRGGYDPTYANQWFADCRGNYWDDYDGIDANGDGIGDIPYHLVRDLAPLMAPPTDACEPPAVVQPIEIVPQVQEPELVEPMIESPPVETPDVEDAAVEEPAVVEPEIEAPTPDEPAVEEPQIEAPAPDESEEPAEEAPPAEEPGPEAEGPAAEVPTDEQPAEEAEPETPAEEPAAEVTPSEASDEPEPAAEGESPDETLEDEESAAETPEASPDGVDVIVPEPTVEPAESSEPDEGEGEQPAGEPDELQDAG